MTSSLLVLLVACASQASTLATRPPKCSGTLCETQEADHAGVIEPALDTPEPPVPSQADTGPVEFLPPLVRGASPEGWGPEGWGLWGVSAISPDGRRLALGTEGEGVWVLDIEEQRITLRVPGHERQSADVAWSPDGGALAILGMNGLVEVVDAATGVLLAKLASARERNGPASGAVRFAAGGEVVVVALSAAHAELWPARGGEQIAALAVHEGIPATALGLSRDGELVALGDEAGGVAVWRARTGERVHGILNVPASQSVPAGLGESSIYSLEFAPDGKLLAIGGADCNVRLWSLDEANEVRELSHCDQDMGGLAIGCVKYSPDGSRLVSTSFPWWEARLWDAETGKRLHYWDCGGGNPWPMPVWLSRDASLVVLSLGCSVAKVGTRKSLGPYSHEGQSWYRSDGDIAWAIEGGMLRVRRVADERPMLELPIRAERN